MYTIQEDYDRAMFYMANCRQAFLQVSINNNINRFLYSALYTRRASNIIFLVAGPFNSLNHLSSLRSIQPVQQIGEHTKLNQLQEPLPLGGEELTYS